MRPVTVEWTGAYLDGRTPVRRRAAIRLLRHGLEATLEDGTRLVWPYRELSQTQGFYPGEEVRLERGGQALLVAEPGFLSSLHRVGREAADHFHHPRRRSRRLALTALAAAGAVMAAAGVYFWLIPAAAGVAAGRVPVAWEERLGQSVAEQLAPQQRRCADPEVVRALEAIQGRLTRPLANSPYRVRVAVVDDPRVNALAAPGGHILLFRGLLERAGSPEEVAGVLAHEIQHVLHRDGTRLLLQHLSVGLLLAALTGDSTGVMAYGLEAARALASLQYSRQAERRADEEGLRLLLAAGIDPAGMLGFFQRALAEERGAPRLPEYLSSHPDSVERLVRLRSLARETPATPPAPILPGVEWQTLRQRCAKPPAGQIPRR